MDLGTVGTVVGVVLALAAAVGTAFAYGRSQFAKSTISLLKEALDVERTERIHEQSKCKEELSQLRADHAKEIGELRGQVTTLTDEFLERLVVRFSDIAERNR